MLTQGTIAPKAANVYEWSYGYTKVWAMRTNIEIDDELMARALRVGGFKTKRAAVEEGLRLLVRLREQEQVRELFGRVHWEGDLERSRRKRVS